MAVWSVRSARYRRSPVGFIKPLQPTLSTNVPTGAGWIHNWNTTETGSSHGRTVPLSGSGPETESTGQTSSR